MGDAKNEPQKSSFVNTTTSTMTSFKLALLLCMVFQNSATVLVARYTQSTNDDTYDVNHLIMITELTKFILSCCLEQYYCRPSTTTSSTNNGASSSLQQSIHVHIILKPYDTLKMIIPSLLYLIQTSVLYVALRNLTAPLFQVTYQFKLVTTALLSVLLLPNRTYTLQQWICLIVLCMGVAIVVLGEQQQQQQQQNNNKEQSLVIGLIAVSVASFSSALAGVFFEMVLKKNTTTNSNKQPIAAKTSATAESVASASSSDDDEDKTAAKNNSSTPPQQQHNTTEEPSLWMRNIQLSFFSILIAAMQNFIQQHQHNNSNTTSSVSYFHGFTLWVWSLVVLQAGGGLLVAAIIKYADNVLKGLATGVSIVFATMMSCLFFATTLSYQFLCGALFILGSVYYFSNPISMSSSSLQQKVVLLFQRIKNQSRKTNDTPNNDFENTDNNHDNNAINSSSKQSETQSLLFRK